MTMTYARNWEVTSNMHLANGDYNWAAHQLKKFAGNQVATGCPILDIGTGNGNGVLALFEVFGDVEVIAIERNLSLANDAIKKIKNAGISVSTADTPSDLIASIGAGRPAERKHVHMFCGDLFALPNLNDVVIARSDGDEEILIATMWLFGDADIRTSGEAATYGIAAVRHILSAFKTSLENGMVLNVLDRTAQALADDGGLKAYIHQTFDGVVSLRNFSERATRLEQKGVVVGNMNQQVNLLSSFLQNPAFCPESERMLLRK